MQGGAAIISIQIDSSAREWLLDSQTGFDME
jgi:hypothetical protein